MTQEEYENHCTDALRTMIEAVPKGRIHHSLPIVMDARKGYIEKNSIIGDKYYNAKLYSIWLEMCVLLGLSRLYINDENKFKLLVQKTLSGEY